MLHNRDRGVRGKKRKNKEKERRRNFNRCQDEYYEILPWMVCFVPSSFSSSIFPLFKFFLFIHCFCFSNNILYPKEDRDQKILLYACRNCDHQVLLLFFYPFSHTLYCQFTFWSMELWRTENSLHAFATSSTRLHWFILGSKKIDFLVENSDYFIDLSSTQSWVKMLVVFVLKRVLKGVLCIFWYQ